MSLQPITLDSMAAAAHIVTFNEVVNALAAAGMYGINARKSVGLNLTLYGGNFPTESGPQQIADTDLELAASTTSYIYCDDAGVVHLVTSAPVGWPGPMSGAQRALYQLTTDTSGIASGTCYLVGRGGAEGPTGAQGPTGEAGDELWRQRKRVHEYVGAGATLTSGSRLGFEDTQGVAGSSPATFPLGTTDLYESVPLVRFATGASANTSCGIRSGGNFYAVGNAGGFDVSFRFGLDTLANAATIRWFVGIYPSGTVGDPTASAEPSAILNMIGVGTDNGDQTVQLMHNDGSGTATKTQLLSDDSPTTTFPARSVGTRRVYELRLVCAPNATDVDYTFHDATMGLTATGNISTDLPASSAFMGWILYANTGSGSTGVGISVMQITGNSRY